MTASMKGGFLRDDDTGALVMVGGEVGPAGPEGPEGPPGPAVGPPDVITIGGDNLDAQFGPSYDDAGWDPTGVRLISVAGIVFLSGAVAGGTAGDGGAVGTDVLVTIPEELRPDATLEFPCYAIGDAGVEIATVYYDPADGKIKVDTITANTGATFFLNFSWPLV